MSLANSRQFVSASSTLINALDGYVIPGTQGASTPGARTTMGTAGK
ncbi:Uncharacterised protein [Mycobacteroides abscessus subsp. abscessus]|nr:Uncharacterised protein [Mycobacteroides abscessus subsp. abscessus]